MTKRTDIPGGGAPPAALESDAEYPRAPQIGAHRTLGRMNGRCQGTAENEGFRLHGARTPTDAGTPEARPNRLRVITPWALILPSLLVISLSACGPSEMSTSSPTWGEEAEAYFQQLSQALTDDDIYGVLDFYSAEAEIVDRTSDFLGATVPVSDWLASHRADLSREVLDVHLGVDQAVSLVAWPDSGDFGAIVSDMDIGLIDRDTILVDLDSLERSLRASPELAGIYESLYTSFAQAWSTGNTDLASKLYAPGATVSDPLMGGEAAGREAIARLVESVSDQRHGPVSRSDLLWTRST